MASPKSSFRKWILAAFLLAAVWLSHGVWLRALGSYLVKADPPSPADIAVVLAGDGYGQRILTAAGLVRQGFTRQVLVSGPEGMYGYNEAELAIPFAVRHGDPQSWFIPFPNQALSTRDEAQAVVPALRRLGVHQCLVVTSNYHTRRAGGIYRAAAPDLKFAVIAAPDQFFRPDDWWRTREGRKIFVLEWLKAIAGWFGM